MYMRQIVRNAAFLHQIQIARFLGQNTKPKTDIDQNHVEAPRKDPAVEVFGKRLFTGEEVVDEMNTVEVFSPMPKEMRKYKTARIYQRSKHVMQQGTENTKDWILEFGNEQRWENATMGWCSSGNPVSNLFMIFPSLCSAICYAEKQGWKYVHVETKPQKEFKKSYADNFTWNKRTRVSTK